MTSRGAYTLIEILIVLALLSLFMAIAIPNLGIINNFKEKQELSELKRDLLYLRNKAITDNTIYQFKIDKNLNKYSMGNISNDSSIKSKTFASGIKIIEVPVNKHSAVMFSQTGAPSVAGSFKIQRRNGDKYVYSVAVASGKINIKLVK